MFHISQNARTIATAHVPNQFDGKMGGAAGLTMHVRPAQHLGRQQRLYGPQRSNQYLFGWNRADETRGGCSERLRGRYPLFRSNILPVREASSDVAVTPTVVWSAMATGHAMCG